jgi:glycerol-3-phosphate cytidylyltransferase
MITGYTAGVFDLFHLGHLNILKNAKSMCDKLIVGVTTDDLVSYKHKKSVIPFSERIQIVSACKYVDLAIPQDKIDKVEMYKKIKFDILFVGDDWYKNEGWENYEKKLSEYSVKVIYFPYTKGTSSTLINETLEYLRNKIHQ